MSTNDPYYGASRLTQRLDADRPAPGPSRLTTTLENITAERAAMLDSASNGVRVDPTAARQADIDAFNTLTEFGKGLRRAGYSTRATTQAFIGQLAEPFAPEFAQRQIEGAQQTMASMPYSLRPAVESYDQVKDARSLGQYAFSKIGEGLPSVGMAIAGGLLGRGAGALVGRAGLGQAVGGVGTALPMEGGETALSLRDNPQAMANTTPLERVGLTLGRGSVNAALENIVPQALVVPRLLGNAARVAPGLGNAVGNIGKIGAAGAIGEFGTEATQELTGQLAENIAAPGTGYDMRQALEAGIGGALVGGGIGGLGGATQSVYSNLPQRTQRDETARNADFSAKFNDWIARNIPEEQREPFINAAANMSEYTTRERMLMANALRSGDPENILRTASFIGTTMKDNAGGIANAGAGWLKGFATAATEVTKRRVNELNERLRGTGEKQSLQRTYSPKEREAMVDVLSASYPPIAEEFKRLDESGRRELTNQLLELMDNSAYLGNAPENSPQRQAIDTWRAGTGTELLDVLNTMRNVVKDRETRYIDSLPNDKQEAAALKLEGKFLQNNVKSGWEVVDEGSKYNVGEQVSKLAEDRTFGEDGNEMGVESQRSSPFDETTFRESLVVHKYENRKNTSIPVTLVPDDERVTPSMLANAFGKRVDNDKWEPYKPGEIADNKPLQLKVNPKSLSAMARTEKNREAFLESGAISDYGENPNLNESVMRAQTMSSVLATLVDRGLEINPEVFGLPPGEPIKVKVNADLSKISDDLVVDRPLVNGEYQDVTLADISGKTKYETSQSRQLKRLERYRAENGFNKSFASIAKAAAGNNRLAKAMLSGIKRELGGKNIEDLTPEQLDEAVAKYADNLNNKVEVRKLKDDFRLEREAILDEFKNQNISIDDIEALVSYYTSEATGTAETDVEGPSKYVLDLKGPEIRKVNTRQKKASATAVSSAMELDSINSQYAEVIRNNPWLKELRSGILDITKPAHSGLLKKHAETLLDNALSIKQSRDEYEDGVERLVNNLGYDPDAELQSHKSSAAERANTAELAADLREAKKGRRPVAKKAVQQAKPAKQGKPRFTKALVAQTIAQADSIEKLDAIGKRIKPRINELTINEAADLRKQFAARRNKLLAPGRIEYQGGLKDGKRHGQGTLTNAYGDKYVGEFKDGLKHGQGTFTNADGTTYVGEFKNGVFHGQGTYTWFTGDKYVGEWKDGLESGQGTMTYDHGDKYVGEWKDGRKHGQGTYTYADGDKYEGGWKDGKRHGQGTLTYRDGREYVGEFKDGLPNGQGTFTKADGTKEIRVYKNGELVKETPNRFDPESKQSVDKGKVTIYGGEYVGELIGGKPHGQGTWTHPDGRNYVGEWKDGKPNGQGTYSWPNGEKYVGKFKNSKRHGRGIHTFPDGTEEIQVYKNDELVSSKAVKETPNGKSARRKTVNALLKDIGAAKTQLKLMNIAKYMQDNADKYSAEETAQLRTAWAERKPQVKQSKKKTESPQQNLNFDEQVTEPTEPTESTAPTEPNTTGVKSNKKELTAAQKSFIERVKKLVGNRVAVRFEEALSNGVSATFTDRKAALKAAQDSRRWAINQLKTSPDKREVDGNGVPYTDEMLNRMKAQAEQREQRILKDKEILGVIRVAAGFEQQAGLAEHEAFHGAFSFFFSPAERATLGTAFSRGLVSRRLREYFKDQPGVLSKIDPKSKDFDAEEAAAYGFQLWLANPELLNPGNQVKNMFQRLADYLRKLFNIMTPEMRAEMILQDLKSGARAERGTSPVAKILDKDKPLKERAADTAKKLGGLAMNGYRILLSGVHQRLIDTENPALAQIANAVYSPQGAEGNEGGMIQRQRQQFRSWTNRANRVFKDLSEEQLLELHNAKIFDKAPADPELRQRWNDLNQLYKDLYDYQTEAGVTLNNAGITNNYYPLTWDPEKVLKNKEAFIKMLSKYEKDLSMARKTPEEIWEGITAYIDRGEDLVNVMGSNNEPLSEHVRTRTLAFITREDRREFMSDDPLHTTARYVKQAVRQAEFVRTFGMQGNKLDALKGEAIQTYGATESQIGLVDDYINGAMGNKEIGMSRELKDVFGFAQVYQNYRLLPFSLFSSLIDPMGIAIRSNSIGDAWETFSYSMKNLFKEWKKEYTRDQWEALAEDWGIIEDFGTTMNAHNLYDGITLRGVSKDLNDKLFKYNLLNGWIRNNTIMAVKAGQRFMYRASTDFFGQEQSARYLDELGLKKSDIIYSEDMGRILLRKTEFMAAGKSEQEAVALEEKLRNATDKFVRQSLLNPSAAELPNWGSNPYMAPIFHLKQFVFGFNATIIKRVQNEAAYSNYKPILFATAYVPGMIAADFVKDMVSNFGEEPPYKKDWGPADYLWQGTQRSGFLGTGQFMLDAKEDVVHGGAGYESIAGPSLEQAQKLGKALVSDKDGSFSDWMVRAGPLMPVYDQFFLSNRK